MCCVKYLLFTFNFLFFCGGGLLLGIGVWVTVSKSAVQLLLDLLNTISTKTADGAQSTFNPNTVEVAGYILIAAGAVILVISFLGCCGACLDSKCLLTLYVICLICVLIIQLGAAIYAYVAKDNFEKEMKTMMFRSLEDYYGVEMDVKPNATSSWNFVMETFDCCGVNDHSDFRQTKWFQNRRSSSTFPESCCKRGVTPSECQATPEQSSNMNTGCFDKVRDWIKKHLTIILGVSIGVGVLELFGIILAIYICCSINPLK